MRELENDRGQVCLMTTMPSSAVLEMAADQKKQRALEDFLDRLLHSDVADQIARIVLFGSVARGEVQPASDIDLLVFGTESLNRLSEACAVAAFETAMEWGESVEPLIYCSHELRFPSSFFMLQALRRGKVLYDMGEEAIRWKDAEAALGLAQEYLRSAENALENGFHRLAIDAAYNSAELCGKGLLLLKLDGLDHMPTSHGGLVQMFGKLYVRSGLIKAEFGRKLNQHLELRNKARYDFHARIVRDDAENAVELAEAMIGFLEETLHQQEP